MSDPMILVINCGSSSLKFALISSITGANIFNGIAEKLGIENEGEITFKFNGNKRTDTLTSANHTSAMNAILAELKSLDLIEAIRAIGHRVVHGGEKFTESTLITEEVIHEIEHCARLAPLHNPAHLVGIREAIRCFPKIPQTATFDTAFHQTMPEKAYLYAVPMSLYREHGVRRYGFHGTSYRYVMQTAAQMLQKPSSECNFICAHLGNGASITAIANGKSADTSMGLTPLEGLVMGTRSGDIDPGIIGYLAGEIGMTVPETMDLLNKASGLLGVSELSNDCRTLEENAANGHEGAIRALQLFCYRLAKKIASLMVANQGKLDALIFTGGIGENSSFIRQSTVSQLGFLNLEIDQALNDSTIRGKSGMIQTKSSQPILVINTDEERMIAMDAACLTNIHK